MILIGSAVAGGLGAASTSVMAITGIYADTPFIVAAGIILTVLNATVGGILTALRTPPPVLPPAATLTKERLNAMTEEQVTAYLALPGGTAEIARLLGEYGELRR